MRRCSGIGAKVAAANHFFIKNLFFPQLQPGDSRTIVVVHPLEIQLRLRISFYNFARWPPDRICKNVIRLFIKSMTTTAKVLLVGGAVLALTALNKTRAAFALNFYAGGVSGFAFDGVVPVARLGIVVQNPSAQSFSVNSIVGNVSANGFLIGNISSFMPQTIPGYGQKTIYVDCRLSLVGIAADIIAAFNGSGIKQVVKLEANANVNSLLLPISITYKIP